MNCTLVTGANRGIGLELVRQLLGRGNEVIATCRQSAGELESLKGEGELTVVEGMEVTRREAVIALAERLRERTLHTLILNAGILRPTTLAALDEAAVREQFEVNALGPLRVASLLHGRVSAGGKVALITSRMGSISDNSSGGSYGYRMSKAALNAAGKSLALDLAPKKIAVAMLHPGWVQTEMTGSTGNLSASQAASGLLARIDALTLETSGSFWHVTGEPLPW